MSNSNADYEMNERKTNHGVMCSVRVLERQWATKDIERIGGRLLNPVLRIYCGCLPMILH